MESFSAHPVDIPYASNHQTGSSGPLIERPANRGDRPRNIGEVGRTSGSHSIFAIEQSVEWAWSPRGFGELVRRVSLHAARTCFCTKAGVTPLTATTYVETTPELPTVEFRLASTAHLDALAAVLLDWRVDYEGQLRTLTSIQRYVEKVRSPSAPAGERALLLQEISRLLATMTSADDWRQRAAALAITLP